MQLFVIQNDETKYLIKVPLGIFTSLHPGPNVKRCGPSPTIPIQEEQLQETYFKFGKFFRDQNNSVNNLSSSLYFYFVSHMELYYTILICDVAMI